MKIEYLADHKTMIPTITRWYFNEWGVNYTTVTKLDISKSVRAHCNKDRIPVALVALEGDALVGVVCLKTNDMPTRPELTPWLAGLFVTPSHRGKGIGKKLVFALEKMAANLGIEKLYLYTADREVFYQRLNWQTKEKDTYLDNKVTIMEKVIVI